MRAQSVLLVLSAALLSGCGIKGPLHPPPTFSQASAFKAISTSAATAQDGRLADLATFRPLPGSVRS